MNPEQAYQQASSAARRNEVACMVISDLCGSTSLMWKQWGVGVGLQAAHEALCAQVSRENLDSPRFKSLGDGVMIELDDPIRACRIALELIHQSKEYRELAEQDRAIPAFKHLRLKVIVTCGEYQQAPESQKWLGLLPTKATRVASYARPDQIWIDDRIAEAIRPRLNEISAQYDSNPSVGAAFYVPLKGLDDRKFAIYELRPQGVPSLLTQVEQKKEYLITWPDAMMGLERIVDDIEKSGFVPRRVVGIGRSGAILGGIIAGNLAESNGYGHIPVDVCERYHTEPSGAKRVISTITEPEEVYIDNLLISSKRKPTKAWKIEPVLLVIGEAKTEASLRSVKTWLAIRGISEVKTVALVKSKSAKADFYWLLAENAWLPWQFKPGYDQDWPTLR